MEGRGVPPSPNLENDDEKKILDDGGTPLPFFEKKMMT